MTPPAILVVVRQAGVLCSQVALRGLYAGVPKERLDVPNVYFAAQQVNGDRMSEPARTKVQCMRATATIGRSMTLVLLENPPAEMAGGLLESTQRLCVLCVYILGGKKSRCPLLFPATKPAQPML